MKSVCGLLLFVSMVLPMLSQTVTGSLVGHVADVSGGAVVGVKVTATEMTRGTSRETTTNETGNYSISSMEPGVYRVQIAHSGFRASYRQTWKCASTPRC